MPGIRQREGLIARVSQIRRAAAATASDEASLNEPARLHALTPQAMETRITHLEEMLEGLQDAMHRESVRQSKRLADLEAQVEPGALAVALSRDVRDRGL